MRKERKKHKYGEMKNLKKFFRRKNISYRELADILGIGLDTVNNKLNGYTPMTVSEMNTIIYELDMKTREVFECFAWAVIECEKES